ncbi:DUF2812 domain-containing protein [Domibacillus epiphyticus]|uniref:DUF2812 domain-containing protein n=1 Tax=Domibacillus epiphyticus TaxID=1714355 RepID=A0A1V2A4X9_9BACI|nr:DUF2812 domain-containing protein [Domibacillus epiphyticus]OMP66016.1 hypothetical protein BTO28_14595 [Domibacillus epiphyticus]
MEVKKFKLFLASNVEKEAEWLTDMSKKGLHFKKYRFGFYFFDENHDESYVYQIDFRETKKENREDYLQLYEDSGWEYVDSFINIFHYFRTPADKPHIKKIYSDRESTKEAFQRMFRFYIWLFIIMTVAQINLVINWRGLHLQFLQLGIYVIGVAIYTYVFFCLKRKINF